MKGTQAVIGLLQGRPSAAKLLDGGLTDLFVSPPDHVPLPEAIYRAEAERPLKGLGGVFVSWPGGRGFLRDAKGVRPGERFLVQVTGFAEHGKASPVTRRILFKSRYCIVSPGAPGLNLSKAIRDETRRDELRMLAQETALPEDMGAILRSAANTALDADIAEDLAATVETARAVISDAGDSSELLLDGPAPERLAWRDWSDADDVIRGDTSFADLDLLERIDALRLPDVSLPSGAGLVIEPTRALIAVDVNTGPDGSPAAGLKTNIAAARTLPTALRLRGLGGQITVDFAPAPKKDRRQVETALRAAFRADLVDTTLVGWTPLGHFELQRRRERFPLAEAFR